MIHWFLIALATSAFLFAAVWAICVKIRNYGFLDAIWSYGVALLAPIYAIAGPGAIDRKIVYCGLGVLWSVRLGTYISLRVLRHHPEEDVRYQGLRQRWPGPGMFLVFFELQAIIVVIFSLPFLYAAWNPRGLGTAFEFAGLGISLFSLLGESIADRQMKTFKRRNPLKGAVCQEGLWRYSRHPNYFFEFLFWVGICIASLQTPWGWVTVVCPIMMYHFLTKVTGIPLTEEYAIKSKGDSYREYQRTTSAFIPWFRRQA